MEEIFEIINNNEDITDKGCLLLDAAVYFPYANQDIVIFDATFVEDILENPSVVERSAIRQNPNGTECSAISEGNLSVVKRNAISEGNPLEEMFFRKDKKYNHRYPNHGYVTISKTYGRKVCKVGYPFVGKIDDLNKYKYLCIKFGINDQTMLTYIPVNVHLTEEAPYSYLTLRFMAKDPNHPCFLLSTLESGNRETGWREKRYTSSLKENPLFPVILMEKADMLQEKFAIIYKTEIDLINSPWKNAVGPL